MLWIFDPKALHHVVVKEQDVYQEAPFVMTFVPTSCAILVALSPPLCRGRKLATGPGLFSTLGMFCNITQHLPRLSVP